MYAEAERCILNGLKIDSFNVDAKVLLASCWVEGSDDPMKGIGLLREIEKTDSNNINLQLSFAAFSVKSAQWEKAIARYKKVLKINSEYLEAYLYLADAYEKIGNINGTIESLSHYRDKVKDPAVKKEINVYIEKLKK
jgi:lipopolysaccharide biosynthesis regulator YciM